MEFIIKLSIVISLVLVIFQDFKYRAVHWALFPLLLILFFVHDPAGFGWLLWLENFGSNLLFVLMNLVALTAYFSIRANRWVSIINRQIGWGDILLFVVFASALTPLLFILFFISGLLLTLIFYGIRMLIGQHKAELIPLAGCLGLFFLIVAGVSVVFPEMGKSVTNEQQLIGLIDQLL